MGNKYKLHWKLLENCRLNKNCMTCKYGTKLTGSNEVSLCSYDVYNNNEHHPSVIPEIKTCFKWVGK